MATSTDGRTCAVIPAKGRGPDPEAFALEDCFQFPRSDPGSWLTSRKALPQRQEEEQQKQHEEYQTDDAHHDLPGDPTVGRLPEGPIPGECLHLAAIFVFNAHDRVSSLVSEGWGAIIVPAGAVEVRMEARELPFNSCRRSGKPLCEEDVMAFCPKCRGVMGWKDVVCPHCGYDFPLRRPDRLRSVRVILTLFALAGGV
jgi:hypothetical protein